MLRYKRYFALACFCIVSFFAATAVAGTALESPGSAWCRMVDPSDIYAQVEQGVVKVITEIDLEQPNPAGDITTSIFGSSFHRGKNEFITNNHVINPDSWKSRRIWIQTDDGKKFPAAVLWNDIAHDLAKLSVPSAPPLPVLPYGTSSALRIADAVFSVGYQFGRKTFTHGAIGTLDMQIPQKIIRLDLTMNSGSSGGPTFSCDGKVIGINVAKQDGLSYIIAIDTLKQIEAHLDKFKLISYGALGVSYAPMEFIGTTEAKQLGIPAALAEMQGLWIIAVQPGSAAERAGIRTSDLITHINDMRITLSYQFSRKIFYTQPGETVELTLIRAGEGERKVRATLDQADADTIKSIAAQLERLNPLVAR